MAAQLAREIRRGGATCNSCCSVFSSPGLTSDSALTSLTSSRLSCSSCSVQRQPESVSSSSPRSGVSRRRPHLENSSRLFAPERGAGLAPESSKIRSRSDTPTFHSEFRSTTSVRHPSPETQPMKTRRRERNQRRFEEPASSPSQSNVSAQGKAEQTQEISESSFIRSETEGGDDELARNNADKLIGSSWDRNSSSARIPQSGRVSVHRTHSSPGPAVSPASSPSSSVPPPIRLRIPSLSQHAPSPYQRDSLCRSASAACLSGPETVASRMGTTRGNDRRKVATPVMRTGASPTTRMESRASSMHAREEAAQLGRAHKVSSKETPGKKEEFHQHYRTRDGEKANGATGSSLPVTREPGAARYRPQKSPSKCLGTGEEKRSPSTSPAESGKKKTLEVRADEAASTDVREKRAAKGMASLGPAREGRTDKPRSRTGSAGDKSSSRLNASSDKCHETHGSQETKGSPPKRRQCNDRNPCERSSSRACRKLEEEGKHRETAQRTHHSTGAHGERSPSRLLSSGAAPRPKDGTGETRSKDARTGHRQRSLSPLPSTRDGAKKEGKSEKERHLSPPEQGKLRRGRSAATHGGRERDRSKKSPSRSGSSSPRKEASKRPSPEREGSLAQGSPSETGKTVKGRTARKGSPTHQGAKEEAAKVHATRKHGHAETLGKQKHEETCGNDCKALPSAEDISPFLTRASDLGQSPMHVTTYACTSFSQSTRTDVEGVNINATLSQGARTRKLGLTSRQAFAVSLVSFHPMNREVPHITPSVTHCGEIGIKACHTRRIGQPRWCRCLHYQQSHSRISCSDKQYLCIDIDTR